MIDLALPPKKPIIELPRPAIILPHRRVITPAEARGIKTVPPFDPLLAGWAAAGHGARSAGGASSFSVVVGGTAEGTGNSGTFSNVALNKTAASGDYIFAIMKMFTFDFGGSDGSSVFTVTGFTTVGDIDWGNDTQSGNISHHYKAATGGETTVNLAWTITGFSYTADFVIARVYTVSGFTGAPVNSATQSVGVGATPNIPSWDLSAYSDGIILGASMGYDDGGTQSYTRTPASADEASVAHGPDTVGFGDAYGCFHYDLDVAGASATTTYAHSTSGSNYRGVMRLFGNT